MFFLVSTWCKNRNTRGRIQLPVCVKDWQKFTCKKQLPKMYSQPLCFRHRMLPKIIMENHLLTMNERNKVEWFITLSNGHFWLMPFIIFIINYPITSQIAPLDLHEISFKSIRIIWFLPIKNITRESDLRKKLSIAAKSNKWYTNLKINQRKQTRGKQASLI